MNTQLETKEWHVTNPQSIIKNEIDFNRTGINMMLRISGISSIASDFIIESNLHKILADDSNLNGIICSIFRSRNNLELCCHISTNAPLIVPIVVFEYFSRLLTEIFIFPRKTIEEAMEEIIKLEEELNSYQVQKK